MFNEQDHYPVGGQARGPIVTDVDDLPRFITRSLVEVTDSSNISYANDTPEFFNTMARDGAQGTILFTNTWAEILNISGAGLLGNVVAPHGNTTSKIVGIRVTVDGVEWTWTEDFTSVIGETTLILGAIPSPNDKERSYFPLDDRRSNYASDHAVEGAALSPIGYLQSIGAPLLAFNEELIVSVRSVNNVVDEGHRAAVTYVLR